MQPVQAQVSQTMIPLPVPLSGSTKKIVHGTITRMLGASYPFHSVEVLFEINFPGFWEAEIKFVKYVLF